MKQGQASRNTDGGQKREPIPYATNPGGVAQFGSAIGNHATEDKDASGYRGEPVHEGQGFEAPMRSQKTHRGGSQGSY